METNSLHQENPSFYQIKNYKNTILNLINKIRDTVDYRQYRIVWQTVNEVHRKMSTARAKLKAVGQEERIHLWKQHFQNLLGNTPKVIDEQITTILVINQISN